MSLKSKTVTSAPRSLAVLAAVREAPLDPNIKILAGEILEFVVNEKF